MPDSIGNKLKAARESRRLTLDQAADITRVRALYLQALENDDFSVMVSAAQGRGFFRIYASFLGLNADELTASARDKVTDASPASTADSTPPAESMPEAISSSEAKPSRSGFWARLLRREPPVKEESRPTEEPAPVMAETPVAIAAPVEEEEPAKPVGKTSTAKKPARKKTASTEEKPKSARKSVASKKKRTLSRPPKF